MSIRSLLTNRRWSSRRAIGAFFVLAPTVAALLAIFSTAPDLRAGACLLALISALSIGAGLSPRQLHISPTIVEESRVLHAKICSPGELREANEIAAAHYGHDSIPNALAEDWRQASPNSFVCLLDQNSQVVASFGILGLSQRFLDFFIDGRLVEADLTPHDLLPWDETINQEAVYISGVVVRDAGSARGQDRARIMMWSMLMYFRALFDMTKLQRVYALAATPDGEHILPKLGFQIQTFADARRDHHNLYVLPVSNETISRIDNLLPDYSHLCRIDFPTVH